MGRMIMPVPEQRVSAGGTQPAHLPAGPR
jgi:hypothetical protein